MSRMTAGATTQQEAEDFRKRAGAERHSTSSSPRPPGTSNPKHGNDSMKKKPLQSFVRTLMEGCMACNVGTYPPYQPGGFGGGLAALNNMRGSKQPGACQFVEFKGIRFIGLGAVMDELTPRERVYDTLEVFRTKTERLVSIGYISSSSSATEEEHDNEEKKSPSSSSNDDHQHQSNHIEMDVETVPLEVWMLEKDRGMSRSAEKLVEMLRNEDYSQLTGELSKQLTKQKNRMHSGQNFYLAGITAHNLGVANILAGADEQAERHFREAISLKEAAFGTVHEEVALSYDELGILLFARGDFLGAKSTFETAHQMRQSMYGVHHPALAMTLNNIACSEFQVGNKRKALDTLEEARSIQHNASSDDLDLLHVAIVYCNCGYLNLALKQYEEARSLLEEALLIQQSVLEDDHRAVRDTLSNLEFTNAFHS